MRTNVNKLGLILVSIILINSCETLDPNAPTACMVAPDEVIAGVPAAFSSACSVNGSSFSWTFGDGNTSTEANPLHTYAEEGSYTVTLTVENDEGKTDETTASITVMAPSVIEHSGRIEADETWIEGVHLITSDVYVDGAIITIEPGATILFNEGTGFYFGYYSGFSGATLIANGTS